MKNLISMVGFLEQNLKTGYLTTQLQIIHKYKDFLKQPLELWMFIPCKLVDGVWVALGEPKRWKDYLGYPDSFDGNLEWYELYDYEEAKDRVLLDGFETEANPGFENFVPLLLNGVYIGFSFDKSKQQFHPVKERTIEYLVKHNLELTPTALKQIGL